MLTFTKLGNYGRLGNQLFQYAAIKSLALKTGRQFIIPPYHEHRLNNFCCSSIPGHPQIQYIYQEPYFHFNPDFFNAPDDCEFIGYFQSEKYFLDCKDEIRNEFKLRDSQLYDKCRRWLDNLRKENGGCEIIALHNRRGDNVPSGVTRQDKIEGVFQPDKEKYHPLLTKNYINEATGKFNDNVIFLVFSDTSTDIEWCKSNITGENIKYAEGNSDIIDFVLQSLCDHNIIANSSFSWWSAWLNANPQKKIIAPKKWFGEAYESYNLNDLYPPSWIVL